MMDGRAASMHPAASVSFIFFAAVVALAPSPRAAGSQSRARESATPAVRPLPAPAPAPAPNLTPAASRFRIHLRGVARIDAHVARSQGKLVVSGTVTDDLGNGTPGTRVAVEIASAATDVTGAPAHGATGSRLPAAAGARLDLAASAPEMCTDVTQAPVLEGADRMLVPTAIGSPTSTAPAGRAARFCLRLVVPLGRYVVHLESRPAGLVDAARLDLPVDLALEAVTLRFNPDAPVRSLDDAEVPVDVAASTEDDGVTHAAAGLALRLSNESGNPLGSMVTDAAGDARVLVAGALLGPAGRGELRVSFAGNATTGASTHASVVERQTHVALEFPDAIGGRLPPGAPASGLGLRVVARATCAPRGCKGWPTGIVEVRLASGDPSGGPGDGVIGAASLHDGEARVVTTYGAAFDRGGEAELRVRYRPDAPWFLPMDPSPLIQPLRPPSAWREFGLAGAGLFVVAWLAGSRLSLRPRPVRRAGRTELEERIGRIEIVTTAVSPGVCGGRVVDAHEGAAVAGARLAIERPGFEIATVVAETVSDAAGVFALPVADVHPGDQLVAEGAWHGRVRLPIPAGGELLVTLVARRRALLDRLVAWARRRGPPFDAIPEPTPEHVRRAARSSSPLDAPSGGGANAGIQAWAGAVERAAYGGEAVDSEREAAVNELAPPDAAANPGSRRR